MNSEKKVRYYKCKQCGNVQELGIWKEITNPHLFTPCKNSKIYLTCPTCNKKVWHTKVEK